MGRLVYSLLDYANLGDSSARGGADRAVLERFATFFGGIHSEFGTTYRLSIPRFQNFGYFLRAHPSFVFRFTATSIPFSYYLTRARSPV